MSANRISAKILLTFAITLILCSFAASAQQTGEFDSYAVAVYDKILDSDTSDIEIFHTAMSTDGEKIFFTGMDTKTDKTIVGHINADGSGLKTYPAPYDSALGMIVDGDGSRAFFMSLSSIQKIEGGAITEVLKVPQIEEVYLCSIQTTESGDYVYFTFKGMGNIWKISHDGKTDVEVLSAKDVEVSGENSSELLTFFVSGDGKKLAFISTGYVKDDKTYDLTEIFSFASDPKQLTDDGSYKNLIDISGDGSTILYVVEDKWYTVPAGITNSSEIGAYNGWGHLNNDGTKMFISNSSKAMIVSTLTKEKLDLEIANATSEEISRIDNTFISGDGSTISFTLTDTDYRSSLYVGHFYENADETPEDVPNIHYSSSKSSSSTKDSTNTVVEDEKIVEKGSGIEEDSSNLVEATTQEGEIIVSEEQSQNAGYSGTMLTSIAIICMCVFLIRRKQ